MNVIMHYPKTEKAKSELQKRVATVHIDAVTTHINSLSCPKCQKLHLIDTIQKKNIDG